jgi:hypothetical protein
MANENPNPLFAYVEARIAAWQAVLVSLKSALSLDPGGQTLEGIDLSSGAATHNGDVGQPIDLPEGAFYGKSVPACIELYLSASPMKKRTNKQIAAALREGGVESNASNFDNTVTGALFKLKSDGKILRFKDGWGLSSWYPAHIRAVNPAGSVNKRPKKKGKKNQRKATPANSTVGAQITAADSAPSRGKAGDRIMEVLRTKPEREYPLKEIAQRAELGVNFTRLTLGKLLKASRVRMTAPGMYAVGRPLLVASGD